MKYWAPVFYQDLADSPDVDIRQDFITNFDYDGDFIGSNNWENFDKNHPLKAFVYYSAVETQTHYFLGYYVFHPRDWEPVCRHANDCHENDMEGVYLIVEKDSASGKLRLMTTLAHGIFQFYVHPMDRARFPDGFPIHGTIHRTVEGDNPVVYIEAKGHGQFGDAAAGYFTFLGDPPRQSWEKTGFPGGTGIIYIYGGNAEEPKLTVPLTKVSRSPKAYKTYYDLLDIFPLWEKRNEFGEDKPFYKYGAFYGDTYGKHSANAPWGWREIYFVDPAKGFERYLEKLGPYKTKYLFNPYL